MLGLEVACLSMAPSLQPDEASNGRRTVSQESDVLAVGAKRLSGLRHALLYSVARYAVRHAHCDVLIVRTG